MEARGKRAAFSEVRWARSVRPRRRQLPQGPSVCDKIAASSDCSRPVNDYVHIEAADLCRPNARFTQERQGYQVLTPAMEEGGRLSSTGPRRERVLPVQVDARRSTSKSDSRSASCRIGACVQRAQSNDRAWSTRVVRDRSVTNLRVGALGASFDLHNNATIH